MFCDKCGAGLQVDQGFCSRCGKQVSGLDRGISAAQPCPRACPPSRNLLACAVRPRWPDGSCVLYRSQYYFHPEDPSKPTRFPASVPQLHRNCRNRKSFRRICHWLGLAAARTMGAHRRRGARNSFALLQRPLRYRARHLHSLGPSTRRIGRRVREGSRKASAQA